MAKRPYPLREDEEARLIAFATMAVVDPPPDSFFDMIVELAVDLFGRIGMREHVSKTC